MATNTYQSFLMHGSSASTPVYSKLVDIKDYPDLGSAPDPLETTTLSDQMRTYINGIQGNESMTFTCNYVKTDYTTLAALEGKTEHYAVWFGATGNSPTGSEGKFTFDGQLSVYVSGKGVNEVREMVVTIAPSTVITVA